MAMATSGMQLNLGDKNPGFDLMMSPPMFGWALLIAIVYYQVSNSQPKTILALIFIFGFVLVLFSYVRNAQKQSIETGQNQVANILRTARDGRPFVASEDYYVAKKFPKLKYIVQNQRLIDIAEDLRFSRVFDRTRYSDLVLLMDRFQKLYTYILGGRYPPQHYFPTLLDMRRRVIETLYSFFFVVPESTQHMYGLDTYKQLYISIDNFTVLSRDMITVIEKYAKIELGLEYLPPSLPEPMPAAQAGTKSLGYDRTDIMP